MSVEPRRRFRFLQEISEGSFGKVYLAEMITGDNFSTIVAIKLLHGKWLGHEEIVMRSRDEARLLGLLRHQNIIRVEDLTSINGQCAVVMEYLDGVDLKSLIAFLVERRTLFPRHAAAEITGGIAAALEAAYNHRPLQGGDPLRVIHRDIKPSNVMITAAGEVKVLDFGTARANFQDREAQTQALAFGSQAYMAPERKEGEPDSPAGDVFSLGVTLYELLALDRFGTIYIREDRYRTVLQQNIEALDLTAWPDPYPAEVRTFLYRMMDYRPENRPPAAEVIEAMEDLADKANDLTLRRFCRRYVAEAVSRREPMQTPGDPLTGSTLVEDASSAFGTRMRDDEVVSGPWPVRQERPPEAVAPEPPEEVPPSPLPPVGEPPVQQAPVPEVAPPPEGGSVEPPVPEAAPPAAPARRSRGLLYGIVGLVVLGVLGAAAALVVPGLLGDEAAEAPPPEVTAVETETPMASPPPPPPATGAVGSLRLSIEPVGGAVVTTTSSLSGYRDVWDGQGERLLADLPVGTYRTKLKLSSGRSIRSTVEVRADQTCTFTFDLSSGSDQWHDDGCD
ncbi:MAG: serine/threonine protein kinase [Deltaproteobacteria bacterium]|nr:serine/threonine protein kinase [Deltaproteobacteria bacterium]